MIDSNPYEHGLFGDFYIGIWPNILDYLGAVIQKSLEEFRLRNLKNNMRAHRVLETVAEKAGWLSIRIPWWPR